jgi:malic enzyme
LPAADGTSGQAIVTDGSGVLSFGEAGISTGKAIAMAIVFG